MTKTLNLVLASQSPRRRELLSLFGVPFTTVTADIDETFDCRLTPAENVMAISLRKAEVALDLLSLPIESAVVLSADTTVVLDGTPLGKPVDFEHAFDMLSSLQGRAHEVLTGFTVLHRQESVTSYACTIVEFEPMSAEEITTYIDAMKPYDKAGAYGIQDPVLACFVRRIDGCYYNVVGLPVSKVCAALRPFFPLRSPVR
jgi:septum formation protein